MEIQVDRITDFGSIAECFAENKVGAVITNGTIPGEVDTMIGVVNVILALAALAPLTASNSYYTQENL